MNLSSHPMRQWLRAVFAGCLTTWLAGTAALGQTADEIRLVEAQGVVEISPAGANTWVLSQTNQVLRTGDRLRTGTDSRAALRWSDQSVVPLGSQTELEVTSRPPGEEPGIKLVRGVLSFFHRDKPGHIQIITRGATAGIDGTEFVLEARGTDPGEPVVLSVIDGAVRLTNGSAALTLTNGEQATASAASAPIKNRGFVANNILQWCFYYPAVLDLNDLRLSAGETTGLAASLAAYRAGNVVEALAGLPPVGNPASDHAKIYEAAIVLGVGETEQAQLLLDGLTGTVPASRAGRLAGALRLLIAAVKRQSAPTNVAPELPTEFLAASYYEQSRGQGEQSLKAALTLAEKAAASSPSFSFAWERIAELDFSFGRIAEAQKALARSVALAPQNAQALALNGFLLASQNRTHEAEITFGRAIDLDNALGNAWLGRGLCRIREGNRSSGREDLLIAAALEPQRALLRSYLGKAFADNGEDVLADHELALARGLDPADPGIWLYSALLEQQQNRPDVAEKRAHWHERLAGSPTARLVFVDESGANTKMTRLRGRAPVGQRLTAQVPHGHYQTTTLVCAIRVSGPSAPCLFEGAMDGEMFLAWIERGLVAELHRGDLVIMDNLATHKVTGVRQAIEGAGARLEYLPPYSPDFNPIENMWSKVKQILRGQGPRTARELLAAAKIAFEAISVTDCRGFFLNARYAT